MRAILLFLLAVGLIQPLWAAGKKAAGTVPAPSFAEFEKLDQARKRLEKASGLTEQERKKGLADYDQAATWLQQARDFARRTKAYIALRADAPAQAARIRKRLAAKPPRAAIDRRKLARKSPDELAQLVEAAKADLASGEARLAELQNALTQDEERNDQARKRLAQAKQDLEALRQTLEATPPPDDPLAQAARWKDRARALALQEEIRMLEQELISLPARKTLDQALYDEAQAHQAAREKKLEALQQLLNEKRRQEVEKLSRTEAATEQAVAGKNPVLERLAAENTALGEALAATTTALEKAADEIKQLRRRDKNLGELYRATREKVEVAGIRGALGQVLVEQRHQLPDQRRLKRRMDQIRSELTKASLAQIRHREALRRLDEGTDDWATGLTAEQKRRLAPRLKTLRERRRQLLEKLVALEEDHIRALTEEEVALRTLLHNVERYDDYLAEHLLWVRNTPVIAADDLKHLPEELARIFDPGAWARLGQALARQIRTSPAALLALGILTLVTTFHGRLRRAIRARGPAAGKPGQGRFLITFEALGLSLLLPLWLPLWLAFGYWQLKNLGATQVHAEGLAAALHWAAPVLYSLLLVRALAMPGGLLQAHFRWKSDTVRRLRRALDPLFFFFVPASMLSILAMEVLPQGLGAVVIKLDFVFIAMALSWFFYLALHPRRGVIAAYLDAEPHGYLSRLRWLWFGLLIAVPLMLLGLSMAGYVYTAASILRYLVNTLWLLAGLVLVHELSEFWLLLTRRRLAYQAALERRRQMESAAPAGETDADQRPSEEEIRAVDLVALSKETRKLLNAVLFVTGAVGLWWIWSPLIPALGVLDQFPLWHQTVTVEGKAQEVAVTLGDVLSVLAIIAVTWLAARNLPSLVEILLLQYFRISPGSRYTIRTLSGYLIAAVGLVAVFKALGGSWGQIQWLVAALGVGIGFGLQEIVANFISGLIILFERPIRVGDYVTVGDTDGTVTRIRIRATTILTRDRKELLVPNKEFITGRLLNWTLSDPTTRLKVVVGVAYGTDLALAERLMLEAAREHPNVLDQPEPWINFMDFGDSALLLELRCIIDDADRRVRVQSALRHRIDQAFRKAGIEIPFPQRDVHLDADATLTAALAANPRE